MKCKKYAEGKEWRFYSYLILSILNFSYMKTDPLAYRLRDEILLQIRDATRPGPGAEPR
jgi:hypothetical protein